MRKKYWYAASLVAIVLVTGIIFARYTSRENKMDGLLDRKPASGETKEWTIRRSYAAALQNKIEKEPADIKSILALTTLFIQEARITGNYMYYDKAALKCVNKVLKLDYSNFEALTFKSLIYLSQHHFAEGLALAQKAQKINPFNAFIAKR